MSVSEPANDGRVEPRRARASLVTVIADERSGVSSEPSHDHLAPVLSARPRSGPLLAVCGLCGGAGASTLAYLTALAAARRSTGAVLLADTGGPGGGISRYADVETPRSLSEVSELLAASLPVGQLLATTGDGLRVLATGPRLAADCARDGVELLLDHARRRYTLTVIDCGTLARQADQIALAKASHVAWVLPASAGAVDRGCKTLDALAPHPSGSEMLLARHMPSDRRRALRELRDLARERRAPLILFPPPARAGHRQPAGGAGDRAGAAAGDPRSAGAMNATGTPHPQTASPTAATAPAARGAPETPARLQRRELIRLAILIGAVAIAACIVIAGLVAVAAPAWARAWLGFTFPGLAPRPAVAEGILAHNLRSLSGVFVLLTFARLASRAPDKRTARLAVRLGEVILAGAITANVVVVAAALGAYRERMVMALMPHGPVELAAYSLAIALYLQDRRRDLPAAYVAKVAVACVALLAIAAVLETWVSV